MRILNSILNYQNRSRSSPDINTTNIDNKFEYNFDYVTKDEDKQIKTTLKHVKYNYSITARALGLFYEFSSISSKLSFIFPEIIIIKYKASKNPLDHLAVALAYSRKPSYYRPLAITYFNTYFNNPIKIPTNTYGTPLYNEWYLHLQLASLYDMEGLYYKSIHEIEKCIEIDKGSRVQEFIQIGNLLLKKNAKEAQEYYKNLMKTSQYYKYKKDIDCAFEDVRIKVVSNYSYQSESCKEKPSEVDEKIRLLATNYIDLL